MREDKPHLDGTFLHVFPTEAQISGLLHRKVICRVWRGEPARGSCREMPARRPEQPLRTAGSKSKSRLIWPGSSLSLSKDATTEVESTACEPETSTSGSLSPRCLRRNVGAAAAGAAGHGSVSQRAIRDIAHSPESVDSDH